MGLIAQGKRRLPDIFSHSPSTRPSIGIGSEQHQKQQFEESCFSNNYFQRAAPFHPASRPIDDNLNITLHQVLATFLFIRGLVSCLAFTFSPQLDLGVIDRSSCGVVHSQNTREDECGSKV